MHDGRPHTSSLDLSISTNSATSAGVYLREKGAAGAHGRLFKGTGARRFSFQRMISPVICARLQPLVRRR